MEIGPVLKAALAGLGVLGSLEQMEHDWRTDLCESMEREEELRSRAQRAENQLDDLQKDLEVARVRLEDKTENLVRLIAEIEARAQEEEAADVQDLLKQIVDLKSVNQELLEGRMNGKRFLSECCDWSGCSDDRYGGWRFCRFHLSEARKDMKSDGYLQPISWLGGKYRSWEMKEDTYETKNGTMHG